MTDEAKAGFIVEAVELPDGDVLLGFNDPLISENHIEYYKLSEIRLAYDPSDFDEVQCQFDMDDDGNGDE